MTNYRSKIAALYVQKNGAYYGLDDVQPWSEEHDALRYNGPYPVVAHPPCARWCRLAGLVEARWGHKRGDDGGTFAHALWCVRTFGGVLEHPAYSDAFAAYGLPPPPRLVGGRKPSTVDGLLTSSSATTGTQPRRPHGSTRTASKIRLRSFGTPAQTEPLMRWCPGAATTRASSIRVRG